MPVAPGLVVVACVELNRCMIAIAKRIASFAHGPEDHHLRQIRESRSMTNAYEVTVKCKQFLRIMALRQRSLG